MTDKSDWNWDRVFSTVSMLHLVQDDLFRVAHKGEVSDVVKKRIITLLDDCRKEVEGFL